VREIKASDIADAVAELCVTANYDLGDDVYNALKNGAEHEESPAGRDVFCQLVENADISAALGHMKRPGQVLIVYAAETENLLDHARAKLIRKNADLAVANDVTVPGAGFDSDMNKVSILTQTETVSLPMMTKNEVASAILDRLEKMLLKA
jgi:phosphopantothenoylcysteine decarboxylase/phosphopantothenate--cysteine ligase